jgi:hypothetical protein
VSAGLTNHGAKLDAKPLHERWRETPVAIREDIAQRGESVRHAQICDLSGCDVLAYAMRSLSLESSVFCGFGEQGKLVDDLVKKSVANHHRSWIMRPLEWLYDELSKAEALPSGKEAA